jgi:hypothetical protein
MHSLGGDPQPLVAVTAIRVDTERVREAPRAGRRNATMAIRLNETALRHARSLVRDGAVVRDERDHDEIRDAAKKLLDLIDEG